MALTKAQKAGKKAWRKKVADARAAGHKTVKVGNRRVAISGARSVVRKGRKKGGRRKATMAGAFGSHPRPSRKRSSGKRKGGRKSGGKRKGGRRKGGRKSTAMVHRKQRTVTVRLPGRTRTRQVTRTVRLRIKGNLAENPLSGMEMFAGGLTLLLGLGVADVTDRLLATHALTGPDANGNFTDVVPVDSSGKPTQSANGASVMEPMDVKRWVAGGVVVVVPFIIAHFVKNPTGRSALQLFGFGAFARVAGKGIKDLVVRLTATKGTTQRLYAPEIAGINQAALLASAQGVTPGPTFPNAPAPGLGHAMTNKSEVGGRTDGSGDPRAHRPGNCACGGTCNKCKAQGQGLSAPIGAPPPPPPHVQAPAPQLPAPLPRAAAPAAAPASAARTSFNPYRRGDAAKLQ